MRPRPEIRLEEVPAPARLAPHSVALAAEVHADEPVQSIADALIDDLLGSSPRDDVVLLVKRVH